MIHAIRKFFDSRVAAPDSGPSEHQLQLAAAALLFEVSRSDFSTDDSERTKIHDLVQTQFSLSEDETETLMQLAEQQAEHATSLHGFTSLINDHWSLEQKIGLVEFMWRVAYADEHLDAHELHLMRKLGSLLYIPHQQFVAAKLRAKQQGADN